MTLEVEFEAVGGHQGQPTGLDEGVHESDETFDDTTLVMDSQEEIDLNDSDHDPLERPPEPTVPDERVSSDDEGTTTPSQQKTPSSKDETTRKISSLLSELVCENRDTIQPDLVPIR